MHQYTCHFDGATQPNPGEIGLGLVVVDHDGEEVMHASVSGGYGTNNCGEYRALILAMELALENGLKRVLFVGDSQLIVYQVMGVWEVRHEELRPLQERAQSLGQKFEWCSVKWVKRESNSRADELSKAGIGRHDPLIVFNDAQAKSEPLCVETPLEMPVEATLEIAVKATSSVPPATPIELDKTSDKVVVDNSTQSKKVIVRGLAGNKVSFTYVNDVVILDLSNNHCSCKNFAYAHNCEHLQAVRRLAKTAS